MNESYKHSLTSEILSRFSADKMKPADVMLRHVGTESLRTEDHLYRLETRLKTGADSARLFSHALRGTALASREAAVEVSRLRGEIELLQNKEISVRVLRDVETRFRESTMPGPRDAITRLIGGGGSILPSGPRAAGSPRGLGGVPGAPTPAVQTPAASGNWDWLKNTLAGLGIGALIGNFLKDYISDKVKDGATRFLDNRFKGMAEGWRQGRGVKDKLLGAFHGFVKGPSEADKPENKPQTRRYKAKRTSRTSRTSRAASSARSGTRQSASSDDGGGSDGDGDGRPPRASSPKRINRTSNSLPKSTPKSSRSRIGRGLGTLGLAGTALGLSALFADSAFAAEPTGAAGAGEALATPPVPAGLDSFFGDALSALSTYAPLALLAGVPALPWLFQKVLTDKGGSSVKDRLTFMADEMKKRQGLLGRTGGAVDGLLRRDKDDKIPDHHANGKLLPDMWKALRDPKNKGSRLSSALKQRASTIADGDAKHNPSISKKDRRSALGKRALKFGLFSGPLTFGGYALLQSAAEMMGAGGTLHPYIESFFTADSALKTMGAVDMKSVPTDIVQGGLAGAATAAAAGTGLTAFMMGRKGLSDFVRDRTWDKWAGFKRAGQDAKGEKFLSNIGARLRGWDLGKKGYESEIKAQEELATKNVKPRRLEGLSPRQQRHVKMGPKNAPRPLTGKQKALTGLRLSAPIAAATGLGSLYAHFAGAAGIPTLTGNHFLDAAVAGGFMVGNKLVSDKPSKDLENKIMDRYKAGGNSVPAMFKRQGGGDKANAPLLQRLRKNNFAKAAGLSSIMGAIGYSFVPNADKLVHGIGGTLFSGFEQISSMGGGVVLAGLGTLAVTTASIFKKGVLDSVSKILIDKGDTLTKKGTDTLKKRFSALTKKAGQEAESAAESSAKKSREAAAASDRDKDGDDPTRSGGQASGGNSGTGKKKRRGPKLSSLAAILGTGAALTLLGADPASAAGLGVDAAAAAPSALDSMSGLAGTAGTLGLGFLASTATDLGLDYLIDKADSRFNRKPKAGATPQAGDNTSSRKRPGKISRTIPTKAASKTGDFLKDAGKVAKKLVKPASKALKAVPFLGEALMLYDVYDGVVRPQFLSEQEHAAESSQKREDLAATIAEIDGMDNGPMKWLMTADTAVSSLFGGLFNAAGGTDVSFGDAIDMAKAAWNSDGEDLAQQLDKIAGSQLSSEASESSAASETNPQPEQPAPPKPPVNNTLDLDGDGKREDTYKTQWSQVTDYSEGLQMLRLADENLQRGLGRNQNAFRIGQADMILSGGYEGSPESQALMNDLWNRNISSLQTSIDHARERQRNLDRNSEAYQAIEDTIQSKLADMKEQQAAQYVANHSLDLNGDGIRNDTNKTRWSDITTAQEGQQMLSLIDGTLQRGLSMNQSRMRINRANLLLDGNAEDSKALRNATRDFLNSNISVYQEAIADAERKKGNLRQDTDAYRENERYILEQRAGLAETKLNIKRNEQSAAQEILNKLGYDLSMTDAKFGTEINNAIASGVAPDSSFIQKLSREQLLAQNVELDQAINGLKKEIAANQGDTAHTNNLQLQLAQLQSQHAANLAQVRLSMTANSTFNLPDGIQPMTYYEARTAGSTHRNMSVTSGGVTVNLTIDNMSGDQKDVDLLTTAINGAVRRAQQSTVQNLAQSVITGTGSRIFT